MPFAGKYKIWAKNYWAKAIWDQNIFWIERPRMSVRELWKKNTTMSRVAHTEVCMKFDYDVKLYDKKRSCKIGEDRRKNDNGLLY